MTDLHTSSGGKAPRPVDPNVIITLENECTALKQRIAQLQAEADEKASAPTPAKRRRTSEVTYTLIAGIPVPRTMYNDAAILARRAESLRGMIRSLFDLLKGDCVTTGFFPNRAAFNKMKAPELAKYWRLFRLAATMGLVRSMAWVLSTVDMNFTASPAQKDELFALMDTFRGDPSRLFSGGLAMFSGMLSRMYDEHSMPGYDQVRVDGQEHPNSSPDVPIESLVLTIPAMLVCDIEALIGRCEFEEGSDVVLTTQNGHTTATGPVNDVVRELIEGDMHLLPDYDAEGDVDDDADIADEEQATSDVDDEQLGTNASELVLVDMEPVEFDH